MPHIIRIRGPWKRCVIDGDVAHRDTDDSAEPAQGPAETVQMPSGWNADLGPDFRGRVRYRRFFNCPTSLDASTPVHLVFQRIVGQACVELNGKELGETAWPSATGKFSVGQKLEPRNEIVVTVTALSDDELSESGDAVEGGMVGEVRLEIG